MVDNRWIYRSGDFIRRSIWFWRIFRTLDNSALFPGCWIPQPCNRIIRKLHKATRKSRNDEK